MPLPLLIALALPQKTDEVELTSGRTLPPEQACYDVRRYWISVRVEPEARAIEGKVTVAADLLQPSDDLVLDLDARFTVSSVRLAEAHPLDELEEGPEVEFRRAGGELWLHAPAVLRQAKTVRVTVRYGGQPREAPNPPWDGGFVWARTKSGAPWIATCNQMQGADLWWPCKDQPDDEADGVEIRVTVPSGLVVASNGRPAGTRSDFDAVAGKERPGWTTHSWSVTTPINTYGIALNIAPYRTISRDYTSVAGDTFPVTYWVLPENEAQGKVLFEDILRQMRAFEELFGPYPFRQDKYGVAETPHLGMEHQSIIAYGNGYKMNRWGEDRGYDELHLHEFAHEWWANLVTCRNWNDFWIHESFASYAQALYAEKVGGAEKYFTEMREQRSFANRAGIAPREKRSTAEMYFGDREGSPGSDIYYKGSWVLHTLRWLLGDERFFPALKRMAYPDPALEKTRDGSACRFATTEEIRGIAEQTSGVELGWFFEVYLRQPKLPKLAWRVEGGALALEWTSPTGQPFPMPVEVKLGETYARVECPLGRGRLELGGRTDFEVDPRARVLRESERGERPKR